MVNGIEVTSIYINEMLSDGNLKAFVSIKLNDCIAINDIKIVDNDNNLIIVYPTTQYGKKKKLYTVAPLDNKTEQYIKQKILDMYYNIQNNRS